jgi:hypothetical protein
LRYVFNAKKITLQQAKQKMQAVFRNNAKIIWNAKPSLFSRKVYKNVTLQKWEDLEDAATDTDFWNSSLLDFVETN